MSFIYPYPNWRFADINYSGTQNGTIDQPYITLVNALNSSPSNAMLWMKPGTYTAPSTSITNIHIKATCGTVHIVP